MLPTDPQEIKEKFIQILNGHADMRYQQTKLLFKKIERTGMHFTPEITLPIAEACKIGDIAIIKMYLERNAVLGDETALSLLHHAKDQARKNNLHQYKRIKKTLVIAENIHKNVCALTTSEVFLKINFLHSFHLACFLTQDVKDAYYSKCLHRLPASVLMIEKQAYILFARNDLSHTYPTLVGRGAYKEVYPALKVSLNKNEVQPFAQVLPARHQRYFNIDVLQKEYFLRKKHKVKSASYVKTRYQSIKKGGAREIFLEPLWKAGDLRKQTKHFLESCEKPLMSVSKQVFLFCDVAKDLHDLHANGYVHGDVKPNNCLFDGVNKGCLIDFDLTYPDGSCTPMLGNKLYYGTIPYVPPEQLIKCYTEQGAGKPGDMYALGLTLYECALGMPPWFIELAKHVNDYTCLIDQFTKDYEYGQKSKELYVKAIKQKLRKSQTRSHIIAQQYKLLEQLKKLEKLPHPTIEERYHLLIYRLLHPDPLQRITASKAYKELKRLKRYCLLERYKLGRIL